MSKKTPEQDHYRILQVDPKASPEVITASHRALLKLHHPDTKATKGDTARLLNQAYDVLSDPAKRAAYDAMRSVVDADDRLIGSFQVLERIAEGGCGKTYKGEHALIKMPVCIKHCSNVTPEDEIIMIQEAQAMWGLHHYGIPAIRDIIRLEDGSLAIVMSYAEGPTLAQLVEKNGRLEPEDVAWIAERLLNILKYTHYHSIVHGDVKPQNVIVDAEKHIVTLVDFGLSAVKPTGATASKGYTDIFAPPEQIKGKPPLPETDFYSLGMTMIYALTGDYDRVKAKEVPEDTPDEFSAFIARLVAREVKNRPRWPDGKGGGEDLQESLGKVRETAFRRRSSNMKPLKR